MKTLSLTISLLLCFSLMPSAWSKILKIEYPITQMVRLCDKCDGRGKILNSDFSSLSIGDSNSDTNNYITCPKCNGEKVLKEEGDAATEYHKKTVAVISFSPDSKRQKLFASRYYRRKFLNKYFADYVLVVTKSTRKADIAKLKTALQQLDYLKLQLNSIQKAEVDRGTRKTTFEYIYTVDKKGNAANNRPRLEQHGDDDLPPLPGDEMTQDKDPLSGNNNGDDLDNLNPDDESLTKKVSKVKETITKQPAEPPRLYLSFGSNRAKDLAKQRTEQRILEIKKKYHLLYE